MEIKENSAATLVANLLEKGKSTSLGEALTIIGIHVCNPQTKVDLIKVTRSAYGRVVKQNDVNRFLGLVAVVEESTKQEENLPQQSIVARLLLNAYLQDNKLAEDTTIEGFLLTAKTLLN